MRNPFKELQERRRSRSRSVGVGSDSARRRSSIVEIQPDLPTDSISHQDPGVSDTTVNRVLRNTRGQDGPVVRGMGDDEGYRGHAAGEPRKSISGRDDSATRSPRTPIAQTFMANRASVDDQRGRRSVDESRQPRHSVDDYDPRMPRTSKNHNTSIPRKPIERSNLNPDETSRTAYSGSSPMSPAVGSVVIPARKAVNRDSAEYSPITPSSQTILDDSNHAARTSIDSNARGSNPTVMAKGLPTHVSGSNSPRANHQNFADNNRTTLSQRMPIDNQTTGGALLSFTATSPTHGGTGLRDGTRSSISTSNKSLPSVPGEVAPRGSSMAYDPSTSTATNSRMSAASTLVGGATHRKSLSTSLQSGIPVQDERYMTSTATSSAVGWPLAKGAGWPLSDELPDPPGTKYIKGVANNVYNGPLAAEMASRYAEPDKYSSTIHIHKEPTVYNRPVVHEKYQEFIREEITYDITRNVYEHTLRIHVQPIYHLERLPTQHWVHDDAGELVEISEGMVEILKQHRNYRELGRFEERIDYKGRSTLRPLSDRHSSDANTTMATTTTSTL